jgi:hypothetical protein
LLYPPLPHVCPDFRVADATPVRDEIRFVARVTIENAVLNKSVYPGRAAISFFTG